MRPPRAFTTFALALLAACGSPTGPTDHLRLTVTVAPDDVALGAPVLVRVRLENLAVSGARTATLHGSSSCMLGFEVRTPVGALAAPLQRGCTDDLAELYLEPGQATERTFTWTGTQSDGGDARVAPGTYLVLGVLESREAARRSPPVPIRLRGGAR